MKYLLVIGFILSSKLIFSQLNVNKQFHENDTSRTFGIKATEADNYFEKLVTTFGEPTESNCGTIVWEQVYFKPLNQKCKIEFKDGVFSIDSSNGTGQWVYFTSQEDKQKRLSSMAEDEYRHTEIIIMNKNNTNLIRNSKIESKVLSYLKSL